MTWPGLNCTVKCDQDILVGEYHTTLSDPRPVTQVAVDPSGEAGQQLMAAAKVSGIPHAFVVDRDGVVRFGGHPMDPGFEAAIKKVCSHTLDHASEHASEQMPASWCSFF